MKEHNLKSNSWHFWLANWGSRRVRNDQQIDICSYIRKVMVGTLNMIFVSIFTSILIGILVFAVGSFLYWAGMCIYTQTLMVMEMPAVIGAILIATTSFAVVKLKYDEYMDQKHQREYEESLKAGNNNPSKVDKEPGFIKLAYRKFKSKTCFVIKFDQE